MTNNPEGRAERRNVLVVPGIVFGVFLLALCFYEDERGSTVDKDYIPLFAALLTGLVNAVGIVIAAFVLRFHQRSQANPVRLELYKLQCKGFSQLATMALRLQGTISMIEDTDNKLDSRQEYLKSIHPDYKALHDAFTENITIVTQEVKEAYFHLMSIIGNITDYAKDSEKLDKEVSAKYVKELLLSATCFINTCRAALKVDTLTEGLLRIVEPNETDAKTFEAMLREQQKIAEQELEKKN